MSNTDASGSSLVLLRAELQAWIARNLERPDLRGLRRICRVLEKVATPLLFNQATIHQGRLSNDQLQTLVKPRDGRDGRDGIGKHVQDLTLVVARPTQALRRNLFVSAMRSFPNIRHLSIVDLEGSQKRGIQSCINALPGGKITSVAIEGAPTGLMSNKIICNRITHLRLALHPASTDPSLQRHWRALLRLMVSVRDFSVELVHPEEHDSCPRTLPWVSSPRP